MTDSRKERAQIELQWLAARVSYGLTNYRHPIRRKALAAVTRARSRVYTSTTPLECIDLVNALRAVAKVPGEMAEAGVYLGGTALMMLEASPRRIHLFDTFEGLPHGEGHFTEGGWAGSVETVRQNLREYLARVDIHVGLFPATAAGLEDRRFAFVHLDLDLYDSTRDALEWFWPRMNPGGILVSHDYPLSAGVTRAFEEFFADQPEPFVPLAGNEALAVKSGAVPAARR